MVPSVAGRWAGRAVAAALLAAALLVVPAAGEARPLTEREAALRLVARRADVRVTQLRVEATATASFPVTGTTITAYTVRDAHDGGLYTVHVDRSGQEQDPARVGSAELAANAAREGQPRLYGTLEQGSAERLASALANGPAGQPLRVTIELRAPPFPRGPRLPGATPAEREAQYDAWSRQFEAALDAHAQAVSDPVANRLRRLGYAVGGGTELPVLYAVLPPGEILQVAQWPEVCNVDVAGGPLGGIGTSAHSDRYRAVREAAGIAKPTTPRSGCVR